MRLQGLEGRAVLVTGAGSGIGKVVARMLSEAGAFVAAAALGEESARASVHQLPARGANALPLWGDVSASGVAAALVEATVQQWGKVDALVHCAGLFHRGKLLDTSDAGWDHVVRTNLNGSFFVAREAARSMGKTGGGEIVLVSSMWGTVGGAGRGAYGAAKAGVDILARVAAAEWAPQGIRVYAVAPGWVRTEKNVRLIQQGLLDLAKMKAVAPSRALVEMEEVGRLCSSLASGEHPMLSGTVIRLDGGITSWVGDV